MLSIESLFNFDFIHVGSVSMLDQWQFQTYYTNMANMDNWSLYIYSGSKAKDPVCNIVAAGGGLLWWEELPKVIHDMVEVPDEAMCGYTCSRTSADKSKTALVSFGGNEFSRSDRTESIIRTLCPHIAETFFRLYDLKGSDPELLSEKELNVLRWLKSGKTSWEISAILKISENTVNFHIKNIKKKLNASNRQHAVAIALAHNIIS